MIFFDKRFTIKYIWSFFACALVTAFLVFFFNGFKGDFSKRVEMTISESAPLYAKDTSVVLTVLSPGETVNIIALDFDDRKMAMVENERGYRGWIRTGFIADSSAYLENVPVFKARGLATFTTKSFEKKIIGHPLDVIEKHHAFSLDIKPLFGRNYEATFPFRIYNYSSGTITERVKVIFVDGVATSYQCEPIETAKWNNVQYFPLVSAMISMGWVDKAPQSNLLLKYSNWVPFDTGTLFPDNFWGGLLKVAAIIVLIFFSLAFLGMIPYVLEKPVLDIVRFSPSVSRIGGKIFVIVFNFFVYYISLQALYAWIGFSWVALAIALICMLRVILKNIPLVSCCRYVYLMDAKCEKCNRSRSYEAVDKKVISCVPYNPTMHGDFFQIKPRRLSREQRSESIYKTDVTPKHYRKFKDPDPLDKEGVYPESYVEEYEYTFKCKYCGETSACRTKDRVPQPTAPEPVQPEPVVTEPEAEEPEVVLETDRDENEETIN